MVVHTVNGDIIIVVNSFDDSDTKNWLVVWNIGEMYGVMMVNNG
jgi:hypothetical protein